MTRADEFYDLMIEATPDECERWHGSHFSAGYGDVYWHGRNVGVHVIACEYANGPKPTSGRYEASHSCRNLDCFNPHHLSWKTVAENQADRLRDGTHQYGECSTFAKLNYEQVYEIRERWPGETQRALAAVYGVHVNTISRIVRRKNWTVR
jgi:hypothetical protein